MMGDSEQESSLRLGLRHRDATFHFTGRHLLKGGANRPHQG
jgi:hypothetical protein